MQPGEFKRYCLRPAQQMRGVIKIQLGAMDTEFRGKDVPIFSVKGES
jgi:ATP-dependent Lon protease